MRCHDIFGFRWFTIKYIIQVIVWIRNKIMNRILYTHRRNQVGDAHGLLQLPTDSIQFGFDCTHDGFSYLSFSASITLINFFHEEYTFD